MLVRVRKQVAVSRAVEAELKRLLVRISRRLAISRVPGAKAIPAAELSVLLTSDRGIRKLNREWRGKDKATDVLSFPQFTPDELKLMGRQAAPAKRGRSAAMPVAHWPLGDVVISVEYARAQAEARGATLKDELKRLLIHGVVHLLGYDHELGELEARRMRRVERYLLT